MKSEKHCENCKYFLETHNGMRDGVCCENSVLVTIPDCKSKFCGEWVLR